MIRMKRTRKEKASAARKVRSAIRKANAAAIRKVALATGYSVRFCYRIANAESLRP